MRASDVRNDGEGGGDGIEVSPRVVDRRLAALGGPPKRTRRTGPPIRPGYVERGAAAVRQAAWTDGYRLGLDGLEPGERVTPEDFAPFANACRAGFRAGRAARAAAAVSAESAPTSADTILNSCA